MAVPFNLLNYDIAFLRPRRLTEVPSWHLHIPFAFAIVAMVKPGKIVELGTHKGDSYCAFCQAVDELSLNTACHAVDCWEGDEHAGFYGSEVLEELRAYHDPLYGGFSTLLKCFFDDALGYFSDGSIDLLHIDGHHTYDSVRHDFELWLPRMSEKGVVLFHDTNVREKEFGVWRLWDELSGKYPGFDFKFGNGLGVLAVGNHLADEVKEFLEYEKEHKNGVSRWFYQIGVKNELEIQNDNLLKKLSQAKNALMACEQDMQRAGELAMQNLAVSNEKDRQLLELQTSLEEKRRQLDEIYASKGWQWLTRYRKIKIAILKAKAEHHGKVLA